MSKEYADGLKVIETVRTRAAHEPDNIDNLMKVISALLHGWNTKKLREAPFEQILEMLQQATKRLTKTELTQKELEELTVKIAVIIKSIEEVRTMTRGVAAEVESILDEEVVDNLNLFRKKVAGLFPKNTASSQEEVVEQARLAASQLGVTFKLYNPNWIQMNHFGDLPDKYVVAKIIEGPDGTYAVVCNTTNFGSAPTTECISILFSPKKPLEDGRRMWSFLSEAR